MVKIISDGMQFLRGVKVEFSKVEWPSRKDLIGSTLVVLLLVVFFAIYLGVVDFVLSTLAARVF